MSDTLLKLIGQLSPERKQMLARLLGGTTGDGNRHEPIAVIGMACRIPGGANTPEEFWRLLMEGRDAIREIPPSRWDMDEYFDPDTEAKGKMSSRWGGVVDGVDQFDASFFRIPPHEAQAMDPQQRLLLEMAWEALERGGQSMEKLAGTQGGVFVGMSSSDYIWINLADLATIGAYSSTGNAHSVAVGRLSYLLDLRGPSLAVDTACSSSLVAVHLACRSLQMNECNLALAGGVHLMLSPAGTISLSKWGMMAKDGRCKTFDARADGFVRGEGGGVVVLKRLSDALRDHDPILAVIRGTAVNQDGRSSGLTAPNVNAQKDVIRLAVEQAGVDPAEVAYVETHGTGTPLGDPIEVEALAAVYGQGRKQGQRCALGAVKTNIGHLEAAAGIAGLIKAVLVLRHRTIPPNLHFREANPNLSLERTPFFVPTRPEPWTDSGKPRLAAVSSFGFGGTNAHVVLEEAPARQLVSAAAKSDELLLVSARGEDALRVLAEAYRERLAGDGTLADICYTAAMRRTHHDHRLAVVGSTKEEMAEKLTAFLRKETRPGLACGRVVTGRRPKLAFVFPGQGSQWLGMARELLATEPVFRASMEACEAAMRGEVDWSLVGEVQGEGEALLDRIDVIQPTLFAIQVSLARLWESLGVKPDAVVGHSMGEVAAAHVAGALSLEDAVKVICRRSKLLRRLSGQGAMAVVELTLGEAEAAVADYADRVSVAVSNSRRSTVIAGDPEALAAIVEGFQQNGVFCRWVKVDVASHSPQMDALTDDLLLALADVTPARPKVPVYSTVGGEASFDAAYWVRNLRQPVRFAQAVEQLLENGYTLFVELSPHPILLPAVQESLHLSGKQGAALPSLRREEPERAAMLETLARLHCEGYPLDWSRLYPAGECLELPTYPWQRESFWQAARERQPQRIKGAHPLLGRYTILPLRTAVHVWENELSAEWPAYLRDHQVRGMTVAPAAAYLEMAFAAVRQVFGPVPVVLEDVSLEQMLVVDQPVTVTATLERDSEGRGLFQVCSQTGGTPVLHMRAVIQREGDPVGMSFPQADAVLSGGQPFAETGAERLSGERLYDRLRRAGLWYGPTFARVSEIWRNGNEAWASIKRSKTPGEADKPDGHVVHPGLLDACLQVLGAFLPDLEGEEATFLPSGIGRIRLHGDPQTGVWSHASIRPDRPGRYVGEVRVLDERGRMTMELTDIRIRQVSGGQEMHRRLSDWLFAVKWRPEPLPKQPQAEWNAPPKPASRWLILGDHAGVGRDLAGMLSPSPCVVVPASDAQRDLCGFLRDLFPEGAETCRGIVHLGSLDAGTPEGADLAAIAESNRLGALGALEVVKALAQTGWDRLPPVWLVTRQAQAVRQGEPVNPLQAPLWGLGRVLPYEQANLRCTMVDLGEHDGADVLMREVLGGGSDTEVAWRNGERHVARLVRAPLEQPVAADTADSASPIPSGVTIRPDATYLITGGLGGLGLTVARWLAANGARSLVLNGRRPPSDEAKAVLAELNEAGAQVTVARADIADPEAVAAMLDDIRRTLPPLGGIVHAAAVLDDGIVLHQDERRFAAVMAPKAYGAWNLHRLTETDSLDFFILFSSAASLTGSPGQSNYAAANAFLDALAWHRRARNLPALTVNWGPWAEVGLAKDLTQRGFVPLKPQEGVAALSALVADGRVQAGVIRMNMDELADVFPELRRVPFFAELPWEAGKVAHDGGAALTAEALLALPPEERIKRLEDHLSGRIAGVMGLNRSKLAARIPLTDLGMDSLIAVKLKNALEADLGVIVPIATFFEGVSIAELARLLLDRMQGTEEFVEDSVVSRARERAAARRDRHKQRRRGRDDE